MVTKIITTSWDDGHPLDLRLLKLLNKFNIPATFYIPRENKENIVLKENEIKKISMDFDIGSHTLNHIRLHNISNEKSFYEIYNGKAWLENLLGKEIVTFCYPGGKYNSSTKEILNKCEIKYARTVELLSLNIKENLLAPTSIQLMSLNSISVMKNLIKRNNLICLSNFIFRHKLRTDLLYLSNFLLDRVSEKGGIFHLWGHSWEIEKYNLWKVLEELLFLMSNHKDFIFCNNRELLNVDE